jgi:hypothetical protein
VNQLKTSAERMRFHRQRRASRLRCITIEVRDAEVGALVRRGLLHAVQAVAFSQTQPTRYSKLA